MIATANAIATGMLIFIVRLDFLPLFLCNLLFGLLVLAPDDLLLEEYVCLLFGIYGRKFIYKYKKCVPFQKEKIDGNIMDP